MPRAEEKLNIPRLKELLENCSRLPWRVRGERFGDRETSEITSEEREHFSRPDKSTNPIARIAHKVTRFKDTKKGSGERTTWDETIAKAGPDAQLIVEAVNALPELLRRLDMPETDSAFLIMWPKDAYGPDRYWKAGHKLPVVDPEKATRFSRGEDAQEVARAIADKEYNPTNYRGIGGLHCQVVEYLFARNGEASAQRVVD